MATAEPSALLRQAAAAAIRARRDEISTFVVSTDYARRPVLQTRYDARGRALYARDNDYHLAFLAEAVASDDMALFIDYVGWAKSMLIAHGVKDEDLVENLKLLLEALPKYLDEQKARVAARPVIAALTQLPTFTSDPPPFISPAMRNGALAQAFLDRLLEQDRRGAIKLVQDAVDAGVPIREIYLDVFQNSQREIGRLWQLSRLTVAQEHFCTAATLTIMNQFYQYILATPRGSNRVICCSIEGDLHEIGIRIVADFFELEGWDATYFGANTPSDDLLKTLEADPPDLIALSVTMTFHLNAARALIERLRANPRLAAVPILVGGRPFSVSADLWREIGADGTALDAEEAAREGARLVRERRASDH